MLLILLILLLLAVLFMQLFNFSFQFREENETLKRFCEEQKEQLSRLMAELEESRIQIKKFNTEAGRVITYYF